VTLPYPPQYEAQYRRMHTLWQEAAFSDHPIAQEDRQRMERFMQETKTMIEEKSGLKQRLLLKYKYAL
jgi:hypothetical protein